MGIVLTIYLVGALSCLGVLVMTHMLAGGRTDDLSPFGLLLVSMVWPFVFVFVGIEAFRGGKGRKGR